VLAYTKANYIHVISHSMGVAIARKAIKGGSAIDHIAGSYEVGQSLSNRVKTFIGLAGVNLGLMQCIPNIAFNYCNKVDGLFPGATSFSTPSTFLNNLNTMGGK
jgi:triacylglycerol lipase